MQFFDGKLKGDITPIYTDFVNCDIGYQGWIGRKYPDSYTIVKRKGYITDKSVDGYECTDIITLDEGTYYMFIKEDRTEIKIYKDNDGDLTELYSGGFQEGLYERFVTFNFVKGEPRNLFDGEDTKISEDGIETKCSEGDYMSDASGKAYDTDSITPSDYLYVFDYKNNPPEDDDGAIGQSFIITDVTDDKIYIEGGFILGDKLTGNDVKYCVLPKWGKVFAFATTDGLIVWHDDSLFTKSGLTPTNIQAMQMHAGVLTLLTLDGILFLGRRGKMLMYYDILSQLSVGDYFNMTSFNNYLLLFDTHKISVVTFEDDTKTGYIIPTLAEGTVTYGIHDKYAFTNYEDNVYILTNYKRIAAIDVIPSGFNKFRINRRFQTYFDGKLENQNIEVSNIKNTDQRLYVFTYDGTNTTIYIYDQYYKIWLEHIVNAKILNYDYITNRFYGGDAIYAYDLDGDIDGTGQFEQKIRFKFGDETLGVIKYFRMLKLFFGKQTDKNLELKLKISYNGLNKEITYDKFDSLGYFNNIVLSEDGSLTLGDNPLGSEVVGVGTGGYTLGDVGDIKIDLGLYGEVLSGELINTEGKIELLGFLIGYDMLEPHINEINNVYYLN